MMVVQQLLAAPTQAADYLFDEYPKRAKYLKAAVQDRGTPLPVIGKLPLVKGVAAKGIDYFSSFDFHEHYKTPEFLGLSVSEMPITPLIIMFYGGMIPGRIHSAIERAPKKPDGGKDYREVRDVVFRDVTSIAIFLFGLKLLNASMLENAQQQGRIAPSFIPASAAKLNILQHPPAFWSRYPELSVDEKVKKLDGNKPISHPDLRQQYHLANEGVLAKIASDPINREGLLPLFEQEKKFLTEASLRDPAFKQALEKTEQGFRHVVNRAQDLDDLLVDAIQKQPGQTGYWRALDPIRDQVLSHPALTRQEAVKSLDAATFHQALAKEAESARQQLDHHLEKLEAKGNQPLSELLNNLKTGQGQGLTDQLKDWANNNGERLNQHLTEHLGLEKGSKPFRQQFDHYWQTLHALEPLAADAHAKTHAASLLGDPDHGHKILTGIKSLFEQSHDTMTHLNQLDQLSQQNKASRWILKPLAKQAFQPKDFLGNAAIRMRTPADWLSLVAIVTMLGYFPVWFNETLTNYLFDRHRQGDKAPVVKPGPLVTASATPTPLPSVVAPSMTSPTASGPVMPPAGALPVGRAPASQGMPPITSRAWANPAPLPAPVYNPFQIQARPISAS